MVTVSLTALTAVLREKTIEFARTENGRFALELRNDIKLKFCRNNELTKSLVI